MNKKNILRNPGFQSFLASIICILLGLLVGYIALLIINPAGAGEAILAVLKNFLNFPSAPAAKKYLGGTLVSFAPLLMCSLSILFAYKVGFFNIGAAGQYVVGAAAALYCAIAFQWNWFFCTVAAVIAGIVWGTIAGLLKAYCFVNEVISGIMLNWIGLYLTNSLLAQVKDPMTPYTFNLNDVNPAGKIPSLGLEKLFSNNQYVTIAIPLAVVMAILIWIMLDKSRIGFELKATGFNKNAAKYCGMNENKNTILALAISGGLAGMGAAFQYLSGIEQWATTQTSVPAMGFNGIAASFLGGLNPIGAIFSSYFIQHITNGGGYVDKMVYCSQISDFISAIIIYMCGFVFFFKLWLNRRLDKREEKKGGDR